MSGVEEARRLCRELGGPEVDVWTLPGKAVERAEKNGRPLREAVQDVVSGWLAVKAREGDAACQQSLLRLWHRDVVRWCKWNAARGVDAEDVAHDVWLRALPRLNQLTRPEGFRPWLWAIAWRVLREHERRPWRRRWTFGGIAEERPDQTPRADEQIAGAERIAQIRTVLQAMPLDERTLLWHAYVDGRTRPQIAELTGLPEGTVNRHLTRARKRFRKEAERQGLNPLMAQQRVKA